MTEKWSASKLRNVADVRVSNVDKKFYGAETPVRLCNYMDVYANDYVTAAIEFMTASASNAEIERFGLMAGDVVITKDSETPDDIGVSAVIAEQISGLVCGYHLALIRPRNGEIDPIYLAKQLRSSSSIKYFAANASGSTRFGLSIGAIENLEIPLAPGPEQTKIGEILVTVDRTIKLTEALIAKQQRIKTGLLQDLLTRGIDEHGNLRSEDTHEFKDSRLGRVPVEWEAKSIEQLMAEGIIRDVQDGNHGEKHPKSHDFVDDGISFIMAADISKGVIDLVSAKKITEQQYRSLRIGFSQPGDVLLSHKASIGFVAEVPDTVQRLMLTPQVTYYRIGNLKALLPNYLAQFLRSERFQAPLKGLAKQSTRDYIGILAQRKLYVAYPRDVVEQLKLTKILAGQDECLKHLRSLSAKIQAAKTGLMQDLLSGKRRVTALIAEMEMATA